MCSGFGHFVDACEIAMLPLLLPVLKEYWHLTNTDLAFIAASTPTGMIIGAPLLGALSDRIGRRPVFLYSLFFSSLFGLFSAFSPNLLWFIALRAALGVGYGCVFGALQLGCAALLGQLLTHCTRACRGNIVVDVSLFCEFLPVANRGVYMALLHVFFGLGVMFIVTLTWTIIPYLGWRWLVAMSVVPAFVMLLFRKGVPESPRFLLLSGREAEVGTVAAHAHLPQQRPSCCADAPCAGQKGAAADRGDQWSRGARVAGAVHAPPCPSYQRRQDWPHASAAHPAHGLATCAHRGPTGGLLVLQFLCRLRVPLAAPVHCGATGPSHGACHAL